MPKFYLNLQAFYDGDERRRRSGEADYGVNWTQYGHPFRRWRVSYVHATGEVYAVQFGGQVEILGRVPPDERGLYYQTLDTVLAGWADGYKDLGWVRERLAAWPATN